MDRLRLPHVIALTLSTTAAHAIEHKRPEFLSGPIRHQSYDGNSDDLLTAGLGATGLQNGGPPGFADLRNPTDAELRRRAIYLNYHALVDLVPNGGYGTLYGPTVGPGVTTPFAFGVTLRVRQPISAVCGAREYRIARACFDRIQRSR